jgi:lysophospholipase L1-like esterase
MRIARFVVFALLFVPPTLAGAEDKFYLKDGDRVVFYGDSITDQRLYTTFAETYAVTRFPKMNVTFVHSGWGGDRVTGGGGGPIDVRLDRDVIAYKPTVVTIMLGMNDASYRPFQENIFNTYTKGYKHIVEKLKADVPGVRLTLIKPSPYDDFTRKPSFEEGYNSVLIRYGDFVHELAQTSGADFADLNTLVVDATKKAFQSDPVLAVELLNKDRIHPGPGGQLLMAYALLKAWNAPALVSSVAIDAKAGKEAPTALAEHAAVTELAGEGSIRWTQLDECLPMPINLKDAPTALAVRSSDIVNGLDRQVVKVVGLNDENYTLSIDGKAVGDFTKGQLADGVNLATLATPMAEQASKVHDLTIQRANAHNHRWRNIQVAKAYQDYAKKPGFAKALEGFDALEAEIQVEQRAAAQPKAHKFELKPAS